MPWDAAQRTRYQQPIEVRRIKDKLRRALNPEKWKEKQAQYYKRHKAKTIQRNWVRQIGQLGCTPELYEKLLRDQGGRCAICGRTQIKRLAVDHCHITGVVRGLLCSTCNTALGCFGDSVETLEKAKEYLCRGTK